MTLNIVLIPGGVKTHSIQHNFKGSHCKTSESVFEMQATDANLYQPNHNTNIRVRFYSMLVYFINQNLAKYECMYEPRVPSPPNYSFTYLHKSTIIQVEVL